MDEKLLRKVRNYFILGILLAVMAPIILTRDWGLISFMETGQIGDTIGGIVTPIISLIGSVLVFYALQAQIEANKLINSQFQHQIRNEIYRKIETHIFEQLTQLREDISKISLTTIKTTTISGKDPKKTKNIYSDSIAIYKIIQTMCEYKDLHSSESIEFHFPESKTIELFLQRIKLLITKLKETNLDVLDKRYILDIINYTYELKFKNTLKSLQKHRLNINTPCPKCGQIHIGVPI